MTLSGPGGKLADPKVDIFRFGYGVALSIYRRGTRDADGRPESTVWLQTRDEDGADVSGDFSYLVEPRCLVIAGSLAELQSEAGGDHVEKIRSFELYRRGLVEPEVVTFDELLARAQWVVGS